MFFVLALAATAFAEDKPLYRQPPPAHMCALATDLTTHTGSCDDNQIFLSKAQECWDNVKQYHATVTKQLKARIGANPTNGQSADFGTSKADQEEAVAAHTYMLKVTETALDDLDKYFDYVVLPEDMEYMSDDEVIALPCYHDAVVPMDDIAEQMEDKIEEMKESKDMEALMGKTSGSRKTNTGSLSGKNVTGGTGVGSGVKPVPSGKSKNGTSSITGVEEDKKKQGK